MRPVFICPKDEFQSVRKGFCHHVGLTARDKKIRLHLVHRSNNDRVSNVFVRVLLVRVLL